MSARTRPCDKALIRGRMGKAEQFLDAAESVRELAADEEDMGDAYVTLCVHAGIAAADALCCAALGRHAQGDGHQEAVALLRQVNPGGADLAKALEVLLKMKTRAGYSHVSVNAEDRRRARRRAIDLVEAARSRTSP